MKVVLSVDAIRPPLTGVGRYTLELARHLAKRGELELAYLGGSRLVQGLPEEGSRAAAASTWLRDRLAGLALPTELYRRVRNARRANSVAHLGEYLFHGTNYYVPAFPGRSVATFHDVSVFSHPATHRRDRVRFMRREIALALRRLSMIITVSEFSRREIATHLDWPIERIRVTPLACSPRFRPRAGDAAIERLRAWGLQPGRYCLCVCTVEPRKNLDGLLDAYARLPRATRARFPLVLAGYRGWNSDAIHRRMRRAADEGWLTYLGYVDDQALPSLVAAAALFVYPSLYEGFGLPVLEAMASGVPVVCSDASSLPEVAGDAAALRSPQDVEGWTLAIGQGLEDDLWRSSAIERGLRRASAFSWDRCAELTASVYRELGQAGTPG